MRPCGSSRRSPRHRQPRSWERHSHASRSTPRCLRPVGVAAAVGPVLFFVCAIYTHLLARDYSPQFALAIGFLTLNVASLALVLNAP
ncbi:hypothetical protein A4G29_10880 [Mycobacterium kansasii]|nr:hypothetical protein A4G29_10880 [Mycobacterium kansasii]